jgi:hypothetical protein|tara:strand:+ start:574 stop:1188 length:615 start_codon:yes stop_codon:yes gene_type:complete
MTFAKILYWIATIIAVIFLYGGFVYLTVNPITLRQETLENCMQLFGEKESPFSILCGKQHTEIVQPIWLHLLPYLPAGLILGLSKLFNINLYMPANVYPNRIVIGLFWAGVIAAILAISLTLWISVYLVDKPPLLIFMPMIIFSGWLFSPILFQYLLAPREAIRHMSALRVGLSLMFITPILSEGYYFLNSTIETLITKSVIIS